MKAELRQKIFSVIMASAVLLNSRVPVSVAEEDIREKSDAF